MVTDDPIEQPSTLPPQPPSLTRFREKLTRVQAVVVGLLVDVLVVLLLVVLVWVVFGVGRDIVVAIATRSVDAFRTLSVEILTVFIFIELFHSLVEYARYQRIRVTTLVDASLAFVLRDLWIRLYAGETSWQVLLALAVIVIALGGVRTLAVVYSPSERRAEAAEL
jgi:uncharacterized membrane protein (DUF373 family)